MGIQRLPVINNFKNMGASARRASLCGLLSLVALAPMPRHQQLLAQQRLAPPPQVSELVEKCTDCRVVVRKVTTISDSVFSVNFNFPVFGRLRNGNFVVGGTSSFGVFDQKGRLLRTTSRRGGGPGEFRQPIKIIIGPSDSVYVYDVALARITVFDPTFTKSVRTISVPSRLIDAIILPSGNILGSGYVASTGIAAGQPFHLIASGGGILRSFGATRSVATANQERVSRRYFARNPGGGILIAPTSSYTISVWSDGLQPIRKFSRRVKWFPSTDDNTSIDDNFARTPMSAELLALVSEPGSREVLVNSILARLDWKQDPRLKGTSGEYSVPPNKQIGLYINDYLDTMIEYIDLGESSVLASLRLRGIYGTISNSVYHWTMRETADGNLVFDIVRFELDRRAGIKPD